MAAPFVNAIEAPIVTKMVRDYNIIISDRNAVKDAQLVDYLNKHAFPRIRGRLLSATDSSNVHIFYRDLGNLADPATSAAANNLVFQVMTDSIVKDYVWRIGAALAASWAINMLVGQLDNQQKLAHELEKQAMADLMELVRSPELVSAAAQARVKLDEAKLNSIPRIFMALDVNPATYNPTANTASTHTGALESGTAVLWLGPFSVSQAVAIGDTPNVIMNGLLQQLRAIMTSPVAGFTYNMVLGPNEGPPVTGNRFLMYQPNPMTAPTQVLASVTTNIGWIDFHAYQHELLVDGLFCTLELLKSDGVTLGIDGLLYGVGDTPSYNLLSAEGPYSVFIDMAQGKGVSATPTPAAQRTEIELSDTFFFNIPNPTGVLTTDGVVTYQVQNLVSSPNPPATAPRTVPVSAGMTALDVTVAIARDVERFGLQYKLLSAVRSPTRITVSGTPMTAPGLRLVPYRPDRIENRIVFDMLGVPPELEFGVVTRALAGAGVNSTFDNRPKSLVLEPRFMISSSSAAAAAPTIGGPPGVRLAEPILSKRLTDAFYDITIINRMGGSF